MHSKTFAALDTAAEGRISIDAVRLWLLQVARDHVCALYIPMQERFVSCSDNLDTSVILVVGCVLRYELLFNEGQGQSTA